MEGPDWRPHPLDILVGYDRSRGEVKGRFMWHPADAKKNFSDDETQYYYASAMRKRGREWGHIIRREKRLQLSQKRHAYARREVRRLIKLGLIDMSTFDDSDAGRGEEALTACVSILRNSDDDKVKLAAAKTLLEFVKTRPVQKTQVTVKTAEDWLDEVSE